VTRRCVAFEGAQLRLVTLQALLLVLTQQMHTLNQDSVVTEISDIAHAVKLQLLVTWPNLPQTSWLAKYLVVLLSDELDELAHLVWGGIVALIIVFAAGAVLVMLPVVTVEKILDDTLEIMRQVMLLPDKLHHHVAFRVPFTLHVLSDAFLAPLLLSQLNSSLELQRSSALHLFLLLEGQEAFLGFAKLVLENSVDYFKS